MVKGIWLPLLAAFLFVTLTCTSQLKLTSSSSPPGSVSEKTPLTIISKPSWELHWEQTISSARKEGKVSIYASIAPTLRDPLSKLFSQRYNMPIEWTLGQTPEITQKILTERKAGLFLVDIVLSGSYPAITTLKPEGHLEPIEPELLLPEVTNPNMWRGNTLPWVDKEHYIIAAGLAPSAPILINTNLVKREEISSYQDLLKPRWKGKIVLIDPTRPGGGLVWFTVVGSQIMNWDFIKQLAKQDLIILGDPRQVVDWVAKGKSFLALAPSGGQIELYRIEGAPIEVIIPAEGVWETAGSTPVWLFKKRPHPNATRLFINWYLSKEGQQVVADNEMRQGTRLDISTANIHEVDLRKPGVKYFSIESEEFHLSREKYDSVIKEIFKP